MSKFVESAVRTNKLHCSDCNGKIDKGDLVIFDLEHGRMESVYCVSCSRDYEEYLDIEADRHPFDLD